MWLGLLLVLLARAEAAPLLVSASSLNGASVGVCFSDLLQPASATNIGNYRLNGGAVVTGAALRPDGKSVALAVSGLTGTNFTLAVSNVFTATGTPVPGDAVAGSVQGFSASDVGAPVDAGSAFACVAGRFEVVAGGYDIWDDTDQFHFIHKARTGDFDAIVQVESVTTPNYWSRSGILLRETLTGPSRNVFVWSSPDTGANVFMATVRTNSADFTGEWGARPGPVDYPNAWLRLRRSGNTFTAFHSADGVAWTSYGTLTLALPATCYLGPATCASQVGLTGQLARVTYANYSDNTPANLRIQINQQPANRYAVPGGTATFSVAAEVFSGATSLGSTGLTYQWQRNGVNISGATSTAYTTPPVSSLDNNSTFRCTVRYPGLGTNSATVSLFVTTDNLAPRAVYMSGLQPDGRITVCFNEPLDAESATNLQNYTLAAGAIVTNAVLMADGKTVQLRASGVTNETFNLSVHGVRDLPGNAIGGGVSFNGKVTPDTRHNPKLHGADSVVVFNEVMYNPAGMGEALEWIELFNQMSVDVDLSGWSFSGIDYTFPDGTIILGGTYLVVAADPAALQAATGFGSALGPFTGNLANKGERLALYSNTGRLLDEMEYNDKEPWPVAADGSGASLAKINPNTPGGPAAHWRASAQVGGTPGAENFPDPAAIVPRVDALLTNAGPARVFVPTNDSLGLTWTLPGFNDSSWQPATNGIGYQTNAQSGGPLSGLPAPRYYPFNGNANDASTNQVNGTLNNGPTFVAQFPPAVGSGQSLNCDGADDHVQIMDAVNPSAYTLSAWIKLDTVRSCSIVVRTDSCGTVCAWSHQLRIGAGNVFEHYTYGGMGEQHLLGTTVPVAGQWYHVCGVAAEGGMMRLYVNAVEQGVAQPVSTLWPGGDRWQIGTSSGQIPFFFDGLIDDVAIWHIALTPAQVAALAAGASPLGGGGPYAGIIATDIRSRLYQSNSTAYLRLPFNVAPGALYDQLTLHINYDDGFVAYLNGTEVARRNAPTTPVWNSTATATNPVAQALAGETIDLSTSLNLLQPGQNILAIHGLNVSASDPDFLIRATVGARQAILLSNTVDVVFNEVAAATNRPYWIELFNHGRTPVALQNFVVRSSTGSNYVFSAQTLDAGKFLVLHEAQLGFTNASGDKLFLLSPAGAVVDGARVTGRLRGRVPNNPTGPMLHPDVATPGATNHFAFRSEIVINEIMYHHRPDFTQTNAPGIGEEWIELYNRSTNAVDLSGWKLDDAVEFTFPTGTVLAASNYLVVAKDAAVLRVKFLGITIVGDFSGRLPNDTGRIVVEDAEENPVNVVRYFDSKPWPDFADGGGPSLELKNPFADNSAPEAWAASDEGSLSTWRRYSFTNTALTPVFAPGDVFHELRLGLLDAGEVLLDNVSVVESPAGTAHELMQNPAFTASADKWRFYGTHSHSVVIPNPTNAGNNVLRLVATGRSSYLDDRIETTLKFNNVVTPVVAGRQYRIAFDAKWLAGSPQLHAELYYNKVARTILLDQPAAHGTPGRQNSTYVPNLGPTYSGLRHNPVFPAASETISVAINAADSDGVAAVTLWYSVNSGAWQGTAMNAGTNNLFTGLIPGKSGGATIQFYAEGRDSLSVTSTYPAAGRNSRALIKVNDGLVPNNRQTLRLIVTQPDTAKMLATTNLMSTDLLGGTIVSNSREVFYDAGVRLHGSMFTRINASVTGFTIRFPGDKPFRGVHPSVTLKRAGNLENLVHLMSQRAGGVPGMLNDYVYQVSHIAGNVGAAKLYLASYDNLYLDSQFENGSDGTLFKMEGIRDYQVNGVGPDDYKLPWPVGWIGNYDVSDLGNDKEQYRWSTLIENNLDRDDYSHYIAMAKVFSLNGAALEQAAPGVMDVDEWMRTFALMSLCGIADAYTQGNPHNLDFYSRPGDGKMLAFPWDWDFTFVNGTTAPLWGGANLSKIIALPAHTRLFHGHLRDLIQRSFNETYMARWITHYTQQSGENYAPYLNYIRDRGDYVLSQLPAPVPFEITSNGGNDFSVSNTTVTLQGRSWIDAATIRFFGDDTPLPVTWLDAQRWQVTLSVDFGPNLLGFGAYDHQGRLIACDSVTVSSTVMQRPQQDYLRVTEINYHPYAPTLAEQTAGFLDADDFEFIELMNLGPATLALGNARFITGIGYTFTNGATLGAGQRLILARNRAAIARRHGTNVLVHGLYTGKLDNAGEQLVLVDQSGAVILDFTYNDSGDWPAAADGIGSTLEILDPNGNYNDPFNWQASPETGGTPGYGSENRPIRVSLIQDGSAIRLRFNAALGRAHTVLFRDQLDQADWLPLTPVPSALRERVIELNVEGVTQRFFRVSRP